MDELQGQKPLDETGQGEVLPDQAAPAVPETPEDIQPAMIDRRHATQPGGQA